MSDKSSQASSGVGFCGLLTVLFIGLKLTNHIDWSWIWVLSPLWIPWVLFFGVLAVFGIGWLILMISTLIITTVSK
jgi:hypothetical protein